MRSLFHFGEVVEGYEVNVLNEREARAAAGIMFAFALRSFAHALLLGDFFFVKIAIIVFFIEFFVRVLINPMYAPLMILGRIATAHQKVEYTGAPQKRFAWALGLGIAILMFILIVVLNSASPLNFIFCVLCLLFLFFESAFGICLGCWVYNKFTRKKAKHCPGGACEVFFKEPIQNIDQIHVIILAFFVGGIVLLAAFLPNIPVKSLMGTSSGSCVVPQRVESIGHETLWKEHHGCEDHGENSHEGDVDSTSFPVELRGIDDPCTNIPEGHPEDMWLLHNGCLQ